MLWIREIELAYSIHDFKTSQSCTGRVHPTVETLDARSVTALRNVVHGSKFRTAIFLGGAEHKVQNEDRFLPQIAFLIHEYFWVTDTHEFTLDVIDLIHVTQRGDDVQGFDARWEKNSPVSQKNCFPTPEKIVQFYTLRPAGRKTRARI